MQNNQEKQFTVVQNGQRITRNLTEQAAQAYAAQQNKLMEGSQAKVSEDKKAQVKRNING
jgi:hypothetical protein